MWTEGVKQYVTFWSCFCQALPGGHALLLGLSYCTGRSTLTRLAAFTANCKVSVQIKSKLDETYEDFCIIELSIDDINNVHDGVIHKMKKGFCLNCWFDVVVFFMKNSLCF